MLILASLLFAVGIFLPLITISKFTFIRNSFSIVSGVYELLMEGQFILFLLIAAFSIVLPVLKLSVLHRVLVSLRDLTPRTKQYLRLMHEYGRWAMLDVMVVAVLIVTAKLGAVASVKVHFGLYVFGAAVLLIMFITHRVVRLTEGP